MTDNDVFDTIKSILENKLHISSEITSDSALIGERILDSMEFIKYLTCIEETFKISISDDDISRKQLGIVRNMQIYVINKLNDSSKKL